MFKVLRDKLKKSVDNISKVFSSKEEKEVKETKKVRLEEESTKKETKKLKKETKKPKKLKKDDEKKEKERKVDKKKKDEKEIVEIEEPVDEEEKETKKEKIGFFSKLTTKQLSDTEFDKIFEGFEFSLLESNIAFEVVLKIKEVLKEELTKMRVKRGKEKNLLEEAMKKAFSSVLLEVDEKDFLSSINKKPTKIMFVGVNGVGKTTSLAKICSYLHKQKKSCVISASDTFRAASIEQLEKHAEKLKVKVVKHTYGSDAAAVAFDAIKHAESKGIDVVLIDTAGRSHSNTNLMDELSKIKRVVKPDITLFVGDSLTGNDVVNQAQMFNDKIGVDYVILSKSDVDQKGGAMVSVSYITKKPILFLGTGQEYENLEFFKKEKILNKLLN